MSSRLPTGDELRAPLFGWPLLVVLSLLLVMLLFGCSCSPDDGTPRGGKDGRRHYK